MTDCKYGVLDIGLRRMETTADRDNISHFIIPLLVNIAVLASYVHDGLAYGNDDFDCSEVNVEDKELKCKNTKLEAYGQK